MGTGLVPIHLLHVIIQSHVVLIVPLHTVRAPPAGNLLSECVDPYRRAASCYHDLRTKEASAAVHQVSDVIAASLQPSTWIFITFCYFVRYVPDHPLELLFAGLPVPVLGAL